jgi:hypothetical protein
MNVYHIKVTGPFVAHDRFVVLYDIEFGEKTSTNALRCQKPASTPSRTGRLCAKSSCHRSETND